MKFFRIFPYKCPGSEFGCQFPWGNWEDDQKCDKCGITWEESDTIWYKLQKLYWDTIPHRWRLKNMWYSFKCRWWTKYTTIKPRNLSHEWCDRDYVLLSCIFEVAQRFLEEEGPKDEKEWAFHKEYNPEHYEHWLKTREICEWFYNFYQKSDGKGGFEEYPWYLSDEEFEASGFRKLLDKEELERFEIDNNLNYAKLMVEYKKKDMLREKAKQLVDCTPSYWR